MTEAEKKVEEQAEAFTEKTRKRCVEALEKNERMLMLFSGDARLAYVPDEKGEHFRLDPKAKKVTVPLLFFSSCMRPGRGSCGISMRRLPSIRTGRSTRKLTLRARNIFGRRQRS